jgi:hypothetical protein
VKKGAVDMPTRVVGNTVGKRRAFKVEEDKGFFITTYDVRDADTGKLQSTSNSRSTAMEKAEELAKKN